MPYVRKLLYGGPTQQTITPSYNKKYVASWSHKVKAMPRKLKGRSKLKQRQHSSGFAASLVRP